MEKDKVTFFWFRRDLRLSDNTGLYHALQGAYPVVPLFIFDSNILDKLNDRQDKRVNFIHQELTTMQTQLQEAQSALLVKIGQPIEIWKKLLKEWNIQAVYANSDYEPYAVERDKALQELFNSKNIEFHLYKDQVIFEKSEIIKEGGDPYSVYTPYKNRWLDKLDVNQFARDNSEDYKNKFYSNHDAQIPVLKDLGFSKNECNFPDRQTNFDTIKNYHKTRDFPANENGTSRLGIHELIWREFFMMILHHFPHVIDSPYKKKYENIRWINNEDHFQLWCKGSTGYPIVDAGMRELNQSGYMHNRVRMITASFLTKHLLIDWRWGERYFAEKLLDFELSSNNGNWQWAAGCGCDAAPYFRIFNPTTQIKKFDPDYDYVRKCVPEYDKGSYPDPIVEHKLARERALEIYSRAVKD
jgi:deoxyribodipyrimidine photo-lyase